MDVVNSFAINYNAARTPQIKDVLPRYGKPGDTVSLVGRIFTKEYGNVNFGSTVDRRDESITAVMMGSRECVLTDDLGNVISMTLDSPTSNEGQVTCRPGGTFIGPMNATIFVSGQYGKSQVYNRGNGYSLNSKGQLFMYHTLPEITSITPRVGASSGSTHVKITGNSFDALAGSTVVNVGNQPCSIVSINKDELVCKTPAEDSVSANAAGSRGLLYEIWTATEGDINDFSSLDSSAADYHSMTLDGSTVAGPYFNETNGFSARLSGYFIAPYTGKIAFYLLSSDTAALYVSTDDNPSNKVKLRANTASVSSGVPGRPNTAPIEVVKDNMYYIEAVHVQKSSSAEENRLQIDLWESETNYHWSQTDKARDELQRLQMSYIRRHETQSIQFKNIANDISLTFTHAGKSSKSPVLLGAADQMSGVFTDMLTYSCEYKNTRSLYKQNFETAGKWLPGQGGYVQENVQAYCGAKALENQQRIMSTYPEDVLNINTGRSPWLCFATMGASYTGSLNMYVLYTDVNDNKKAQWVTVKNLWTPSKDWSYQCINMFETVKNTTISLITPKPSTVIEVQDLTLSTNSAIKGKYYMDEITISAGIVEIERKAPAMPNDNVMVKEVIVSAGTSAGVYDVEIVPKSCNPQEDDLELFGLRDAEIVGLDTSSMTPEAKYNAEREYLKTRDTVTFSSIAWGSGTITVTRKVRGSRAMKGSFSLTYKGQTIVLPPYPTEVSLAPALEGFGMVGVTTTFVDNKCYNTIIDISFSNSLGGDVDDITLDASNLEVDGVGTNTFAMTTRQNGGIMVQSPGGDFFRKPATGLEVSVSVNGFLSTCSVDAEDCSFSYDASLTPTLASVSDSIVNGGVVLTIAGNGFSSVLSENIVKVGDLRCDVIASTSSEIQCALESGPAGVYDISVVVVNAGLATGAQLTYEVEMKIFSSSPAAGSNGGGTTITVIGSGFPETMEAWSSGSVMIDGSMCKVIITSFSNFKCITSAKNMASRRKRAASEIVVTVGASTATGGSFNYDSSMTPAVTSLSTHTSTPMGGEELTILGTAFGPVWGDIIIGDNKCVVKSWISTKIVCTLPGNPHGTYPVHISVDGNGYADVSNVDGITYTFVVTGMSPRKGSLMGGTTVKVNGDGFGNCSHVAVNFGDQYSCQIKDCTDSEITCVTEKISQTVQITNSGRHPTYGPGYVWSKPDITIKPGDTVQWIWNLQVASDETKISVHQVSDSSSDVYDGKGFKSMAGAKGRFSKRFMNTGVFYYSSAPVFKDRLFMKGVIRVVSSTEDVDAPLSVKMGDVEAAQEVFDNIGAVVFNGCLVTNNVGCSEDPTSTELYMFRGAACLTPKISAIEIVSGGSSANVSTLEVFNGASLSLTGTGFSSNACQNIVNIGSSICNIDSASETNIICTVDGQDSNIESLQGQGIGLNVLNLGMAVLETEDFEIVLVPKIESANIAAGSWAGGSIYTFQGFALIPEGGKDTVMITFGSYPYAMGCTVIEATFTSISCVVPDMSSFKGSDTSKTVSVTISMGYNSFNPISSGSFEYEFTDALTSTATSMDSSSVSGDDVVEITGQNFGANVKVFLRKQQASRLRRRSPLVKRDTSSFEYIEAEESSGHFWSMISTEPINWRCLDGNCDHDAVVGGMTSEPSSRVKRSQEEDSQLYYLAQVNTDKLLEEICKTDVEKCMQLLSEHEVMLGKRSTVEELLEMSLTGLTYEASVSSNTATSILFQVPAVPAGSYDVLVYVEGQGNSLSTLGSLQNKMVLNSITPSSGSIHGGNVITIGGSGFCLDEGATTVTIGGSICEVTEVTLGTVICTTPAGSDGSAQVSVTSCTQTATSAYTYSTSMSPVVYSISPTSASGPVSVSISGSNFGVNPQVLFAKIPCTVTTSTDVLISCDIGALPGGQYAVTVNNMNLGLSNDDIVFESILNVASISPSSGSYGGGSLLIIQGTGFDNVNQPEVKVCDAVCSLISVTTEQIECLTPANSETGAQTTCDVSLTQLSGSVNSNSAFTYDRSLTPMLSSVSPLRGGTGGGTKITITGSGFATSGNIVTIDGSTCVVDTESENEITCYTDFHNGAVQAPVIVEVPSQGYAAYSDIEAATFYYIDRWSSIWTWGGTGTPLEGEYIVITNGQTILLDESTPVLKFLLIKGGTLMFDRTNPEIELQTEYILIVEGGKLEIGTEEEPYDSKAIITMHGNVRCTELPIFGCKVT